ncbi:MAG: YhfX family PLP-dependent enzyme [Hyphomicrobiales bacterium]|nr:YhfX family PLP-dependent enzyme [Hyphomicrobiales bacterium]
MFLDVLQRRNPGLIENAIALHQAGRIPANTYVIDLDAVEANARVISTEADRLGLKTFAMTKQMGRNKDFCSAVMRGGITSSVNVDMECARATHRAGMAIGHIGHLVQIPRAEARAAASLSPTFWTVFNHDKAHEAAKAAAELGRVQSFLARIQAKGDRFYRGHEGGFDAAAIDAVADRIDAMDGARFSGITTFPALLFDTDEGKVAPTQNLTTLEKAAEALTRSGRQQIEINAPGTSSSAVIGKLAEAGATQIEPGHGLTGTTPLHAVEDLEERPAVVYVSEVSHFHGTDAFCFGGGLYIDPVFPDYAVKAIVAREPTAAADALRTVEIPPPAAIDYYGMIDTTTGDRKPAVGDTVIFGFRPQAFVTRAYTCGVSGVAEGSPSAGAIYDAFGRAADWPL